MAHLKNKLFFPSGVISNLASGITVASQNVVEQAKGVGKVVQKSLEENVKKYFEEAEAGWGRKWGDWTSFSDMNPSSGIFLFLAYSREFQQNAAGIYSRKASKFARTRNCPLDWISKRRGNEKPNPSSFRGTNFF